MAALLVIMQAIFMELLNASLINVAIPSIKAGFNASPQAAQWLISGYALGFAVVLPAAGMLADRLGHKRVFLAGLALFTLASAGCGVASNMGVLIAARAGQGMGNAMVAPQIMGFLQILFSPTERVSKLPWLGLASGTGATLGPLLAALA